MFLGASQKASQLGANLLEVKCFINNVRTEIAAIYAIAMPIADPRNRAISETRGSNAALRFQGAMESR